MVSLILVDKAMVLSVVAAVGEPRRGASTW